MAVGQKIPLFTPWTSGTFKMQLRAGLSGGDERRRSAPVTLRRVRLLRRRARSSILDNLGSRWRGSGDSRAPEDAGIRAAVALPVRRPVRPGRTRATTRAGRGTGRVDPAGFSGHRCRTPASRLHERQLVAVARRRLGDRLRGHGETIGEQLARDAGRRPQPACGLLDA